MVNNVKTVDRDEWGVRGIKGKAIVSSRMVSEIFGKRHDHVLRDIDNAKGTLQKVAPQFWVANFTANDYINRGKKYPEFMLTKDGFTYIAMGFTGKGAAQFKVEYITRFNAMEEALENRDMAKVGYKELVEVLDENGAGHWDKPNEFDMINLIVLGKKAKAFRESNEILE